MIFAQGHHHISTHKMPFKATKMQSAGSGSMEIPAGATPCLGWSGQCVRQQTQQAGQHDFGHDVGMLVVAPYATVLLSIQWQASLASRFHTLSCH